MKRKETLGRLLLTLLTAFVMVAGAFVAAAPAFTEQDTSGPVVVRELDEGTREVGEAPASANFNAMNTETQSDMVAALTDTIPTGEMELPEEHQEYFSEDAGLVEGTVYNNNNNQVNQESNLEGTTISDSGTRSATVDAGGPYGTEAAPLYEGNPVNFVAQIAGDINDNYMFRWDVNDDGNYEGPGPAPDYWGAYGDNDLNVQMNDNHIGEAKVEAWDGVSLVPEARGGNLFENTPSTTYWYLGSAYAYNTKGYRFTTNQAITVTELGWYDWYYPYQVYYVDIWEYPSQTWVGGSGYITGSQSNYAWNWRTLSTPISLTTGEYVISVYMRTYYGYSPVLDDPTPTSDGIIEITQGRHYRQGYGFPYYSYSSTQPPAIDFEYEYTYYIEDVFEDSADVFIDNVAPIVINPTATVPRGQEGSEVEFTGWFMDPGTDDDWSFRWDWGDGTQSPWTAVPKYDGGVRCLLLHTLLYGTDAPLMTVLSSGLGNWNTGLDSWSIMDTSTTTNNIPELEDLEPYDVIVYATNYVWTNPDLMEEQRQGIGDVLADYADTGGGVVQTMFSFSNFYGGFISGRWLDDGYNTIPLPSPYYYSPQGSVVTDPGHSILTDYEPFGAMSTTYNVRETPANGAHEVARMANYGTLLAVMDYGDFNNPGNGRTVGLNSYPAAYYNSGDWKELLVDCVKWASGNSAPTVKQMPIKLPLMGHVYADDHPTTTTPEDVIQATLQVKDDDHERVIGGAGPDWNGKNYAEAPQAVATHSGGGSGVWGPDRLNNGDKIGTYNDCWTAYGGGINWNQLVWPSAVTIGGTKTYYTRYRTLPGYNMHSCDIEYWSGSSWVFVLHYDDLDHNNHYRDATIAFPAPITTTRLRMSNMLTYTTNGNIMIQEWEVFGVLPGGDSYTMVGLGEGSTTVTIENVFPSIIVPDYDEVVDERYTMEFEGFKITDPALMEDTEAFWYRWDYGDGTPIGPWIYKGSMAKPNLDVLLLSSYYGQTGPIIAGLEAIMGPTVTIDNHDCSPYGTVPPLSLLMQYDAIVIGSNYVPNAAVGNLLDDYADAGGGVVELVAMWHTQFGISGQWRAKGYPVFPSGAATASYTSVDILDPLHPIIDGGSGTVSNWGCSLAMSSSSVTPGAVRLAEAGSNVAAAYRNENDIAPGSGRVAGINVFAQSGYWTGDAYLAIANALWWVSQADVPTPVLDTQTHDYGDNGIYTAGLQVIDDDMNWAWAPGDAQPTFTGTGDPNDWVTFVYFPVEALNVDPVISPRMRAEVSLDLVIRTTGEPKNDATMTLWEGTTALGSVTVHHDGNYKMETLPATLNMNNINDYYVTVEYENADPDGANPTWVFSGKFPSGHTKELKKVFKDDGSLWTIDSSLLKTMLIGEDIVFTAIGADDGSDDLAFNWQFGDGGNDIHVFANADSSMVEGTSQQPEDIFNAHPDRDLWFDRGLNDERSPNMNPIVIVDEISHAFSEGGFFYVTLILMDDDVCDGYPSAQVHLNGGGYDIEFMEIDLS